MTAAGLHLTSPLTFWTKTASPPLQPLILNFGEASDAIRGRYGILGIIGHNDVSSGHVVRNRVCPPRLMFIEATRQFAAMVVQITREGGLSRCCAASAKCRRLKNCQAAATAVRHVSIAAARSARCVWADVRWRWTLNVL